MKSSILPLAFLVIAFSSCTTAYKSGQTPDDVYFSPVRPEEEYVRTESKEESRYDGDEYYDDQYLRMKVRNRYRWSDLEDPYYNRRSYVYNTYSCCYCKNPWTPSAYWNYYYNPYYNYNVVGSKTTVYTAPRKVNLAAYNPQPQINTKGYTTPRNYTGSTKNDVYTSPRNSTRANDDGNSGNILRSIFSSNSNKNSSSGSNSNTNTSSGSSNNNSSSSSSSGSSGSSAPVRKF
jgi:hypothetical protein